MLAYQTTFDPARLTGQLPINTSLINKDKFKKTLSVMTDMFKAGVDVSDLVAIALVRETGFSRGPTWENWISHRL